MFYNKFLQLIVNKHVVIFVLKKFISLPVLKKTALKTEHIDKHYVDLSKEELIDFRNGGKVVVYNAIDRNTDDFRRILSCAKFFALQGKQVVMPPKLDVPYKNPAYDQIFGSLRGTPYYGKCPDLLVDGVWYEHEGFSRVNPKSNFSNMLRRGLSQSERIIIEKCSLSERIMRKSIRDRMASGVRIKEIWIHDGETVTLFFKNTEGQ